MESDKWTEEELQALEKKISQLYGDAAKDLQATIDDYFKKFKKRDDEMRQLLDDGKITEEHYRLWRMAQMGRGERYEAIRDEIARRCNQANQVAVAHINDTTPGIYSMNYNYSAYTIEQVHGNVGFNIFNEQAVRRLIMEDPDLFPAPSIDIPKDLRWNREKLQRELITGIMNGESLGKIADRFQSVTDMNLVSALRNARTAVTSAQNAGRQESFNRAADMGIKLRKRWVCTKDMRTRHSHGMLDGTVINSDELFVSELGSEMEYPGDNTHGASPADLYNCRCSIRSVEKEGIEAEPRMMRVRDPETGENVLVSEMTYSEWTEWKTSEAAKTAAEDDAAALSFFKANGRDSLNSIVKRSTIKLQNGFACFPDGDPLNENTMFVKPLKTYFDVAMHGTPMGVCFGTKEANMSARLLASVIRHSEGYHGQKIRLLCCSTGKIVGGEYCFAEELANALGVEVKAPNDDLYITKRGGLSVGEFGDGKFVSYKPNQRRRIK